MHAKTHFSLFLILLATTPCQSATDAAHVHRDQEYTPPAQEALAPAGPPQCRWDCLSNLQMPRVRPYCVLGGLTATLAIGGLWAIETLCTSIDSKHFDMLIQVV